MRLNPSRTGESRLRHVVFRFMTSRDLRPNFKFPRGTRSRRRLLAQLGRTRRARVRGWLSYSFACRARQPPVTHVSIPASTRWVSPSVSEPEPRTITTPLFGRKQAATDHVQPAASRFAGRTRRTPPSRHPPPKRVAPVELERSVYLLSPGAWAVRPPPVISTPGSSD